VEVKLGETKIDRPVAILDFRSSHPRDSISVNKHENTLKTPDGTQMLNVLPKSPTM
jgi:hypothetical protein